MGSDLGGCLVTDNDQLAERIRFVGQSRGGVMEPGFGRKHVMAGHAFRMPFCTAALCLAQLEIIREQVAQRDRMVRFLSQLVAEIPGIAPLPIPGYLDVYSAWMFSFNIRSGPVPMHGGGFREATCRRGDSRGGHGQVLFDAGGRHVPRRKRAEEGLSILDAAGFEGVSLRRRNLPERLEVPPDLGSLVDVLRKVYREAL